MPFDQTPPKSEECNDEVVVIEPAKRRKGIYKFLEVKDHVYQTSILTGIVIDESWLRVENGTITLKGSNGDGFAWDGCTPKLNVFDLVLLGTPDGRVNINTTKPVTYYASMIHDVLCQHVGTGGLTRKQADDVFLELLGDFDLRYLYYLAVRIWGIISQPFR